MTTPPREAMLESISKPTAALQEGGTYHKIVLVGVSLHAALDKVVQVLVRELLERLRAIRGAQPERLVEAAINPVPAHTLRDRASQSAHFTHTIAQTSMPRHPGTCLSSKRASLVSSMNSTMWSVPSCRTSGVR